MSRPDEMRGSTQDYVDLLMQAQDLGFVRTTMASLDEEQVTGSFNSIVKNSSPIWSLTLARLQVFSQARFQWTRPEGGVPGELFGTPELGILEKPWPGGTTADLLARMELDATGAGNSYTRRLRRTRFGEDRLVRLRPDWVIVIMGSREDADHPAEAADVELLGYAYVPHGDRADRMVLMEPDEIGHYAPYPDPDAVLTGMSWITAAMKDVLGDNLQTDHKRAFLKNAATPNLVIKFDPTITIDAVKKFKSLFEAEHKGAWNAYKTLFLGGGADVTPVGADFKQLDFAITQGKAESRMASSAGVPPSWVGFSEGLQGSALNAGNFTAARRRFGDGTMQHLWANAATSLETIVTPPEGAQLWFATRGIPFLNMDAQDEADVQAKEAQTIVQLVRDGFTPESAIDAVKNHDFSRLVHTGLLSVQLQPPGITPNGSGDPNAARAALLGGNTTS
jgi:hypothetical protein